MAVMADYFDVYFTVTGGDPISLSAGLDFPASYGAKGAYSTDIGLYQVTAQGPANSQQILDANTLTVGDTSLTTGPVTIPAGEYEFYVQQTADVLAFSSGGPVIATATFNLSDMGSSVPEPSTLVLLGIGAVSLIAYAWRKRR
jgi:hypothetical protein